MHTNVHNHEDKKTTKRLKTDIQRFIYMHKCIAAEIYTNFEVQSWIYTFINTHKNRGTHTYIHKNTCKHTTWKNHMKYMEKYKYNLRNKITKFFWKKGTQIHKYISIYNGKNIQIEIHQNK